MSNNVDGNDCPLIGEMTDEESEQLARRMAEVAKDLARDEGMPYVVILAFDATMAAQASIFTSSHYAAQLFIPVIQSIVDAPGKLLNGNGPLRRALVMAAASDTGWRTREYGMRCAISGRNDEEPVVYEDANEPNDPTHPIH